MKPARVPLEQRIFCNPGEINRFLKHFHYDRLWGTSSPLSNWYLGLFARGWSNLAVKLSTHDHLDSEVKNALTYNSIPPYTFMAWYLVKHRNKFTLLILPLNLIQSQWWLKNHLSKSYLSQKSYHHKTFQDILSDANSVLVSHVRTDAMLAFLIIGINYHKGGWDGRVMKGIWAKWKCAKKYLVGKP